MPTLGFLKKKKKEKESQRSKDNISISSLQKEEQLVEEPSTPISLSQDEPTVASQPSVPSAPQQANASAPPSTSPEPMALVSDRPMIPEQQQYQTATPTTTQSQPHQSNINSIINPPQDPPQDYSRYYDSSPQQQPQQQSHSQQQSTQQNAARPDMLPSQVPSANNGGVQAAALERPDADRVREGANQSQVRSTKGKYSLTDFAIQRTLGTGSFGRVHLVQSRHNLRFYAVKVLKKAQVVKMKQVEHTNDERKMLQKVKHPFLITLWGTFQDSKNLYMVMDFIEGGELFSLLRKSQVRQLALLLVIVGRLTLSRY